MTDHECRHSPKRVINGMLSTAQGTAGCEVLPGRRGEKHQEGGTTSARWQSFADDKKHPTEQRQLSGKDPVQLPGRVKSLLGRNPEAGRWGYMGFLARETILCLLCTFCTTGNEGCLAAGNETSRSIPCSLPPHSQFLEEKEL